MDEPFYVDYDLYLSIVDCRLDAGIMVGIKREYKISGSQKPSN